MSNGKIGVMKIKIEVNCNSFSLDGILPDGRYVAGEDLETPLFMKPDADSDEVEFEIDLNTGQILNWRPPDKLEMDRIVEEIEDNQ